MDVCIRQSFSGNIHEQNTELYMYLVWLKKYIWIKTIYFHYTDIAMHILLDLYEWSKKQESLQLQICAISVFVNVTFTSIWKENDSFNSFALIQ